MDGKELLKITKETFKTDNPTKEQLDYVLTTSRPSSYILKHSKVKGHPLTFSIPNRDSTNAHSHRPWQTQIVNDQHPNKAIIKARQLGLSEMGVWEMMWFADMHSYASAKCLYTFPTNRQMKEFVQTRLDPTLEQPYFKSIVDKDYNSVQLKRFRNSSLFFRTSSKPGSVEGVDIDFLSLDEYDRINKLAEASAEESMSSSKFGVKRRWSTPSAPNTGIHRLFEASDQHQYLHKCDKCNHWNQMSYEDYDSSSVEAGGNILCVNPDGVDRLSQTVVDGTFQYVCQKCGKPLDRWYNGAWVAKYPERTKDGGGIRGYSISQMNAVWITADDLKRKELATPSKQAFYNYMLGFPYEDASLTVLEEDVFDNYAENLLTQKHDRKGYKYISCSVDWGRTHYCTVHGMTESGEVHLIRLFSIPEVRDPKQIGMDVQQIIIEFSKYKPDIVMADKGDSGDKVLKLINHFGEGRVFSCEYKSAPKSTGEFVPQVNANQHNMKVDKLTQNKIYIDALKSGYIKTYKIIDEDLKKYLVHWKNVVIRDEEDETNGGFYQTISRKGDDHYSQASVIGYIGLKRLQLLNSGGGNEFGSTFISTLNPDAPKGGMDNEQDVSSLLQDIYKKD